MAPSIENVTVVDSGAYDCGVCQCPLKPPIFQCEVGHMVCSECSEKMAGAETCHVCRRALAGGYKRCYGAEHIVESLRVPCPNKDYGCSDKLARYEESAHLQACWYRPFHCPAEVCTFVSCNEHVLADHFIDSTRSHRWPCTRVYDGSPTNLALVDGFNVIFPLPCSPPPGNPRYTERPQIVLLKVARQSYGRVVTPIHVCRGGGVKCGLKLVYDTPGARGSRRLEYAFNMPSTDISASGGLSSPDDFVVPKSLQPLYLDTIKVQLTCWYLDPESYYDQVSHNLN